MVAVGSGGSADARKDAAQTIPFSAVCSSPRDSEEEAVEPQAKPYGGCREGDANDKP
jgi:hypothetical protein